MSGSILLVLMYSLAMSETTVAADETCPAEPVELTVRLTQRVASAQLSIDHRPMGRLPFSGAVCPGRRILRIAAPGYEPVVLEGLIFEGQPETVVMTLTQIYRSEAPREDSTGPVAAPLPTGRRYLGLLGGSAVRRITPKKRDPYWALTLSGHLVAGFTLLTDPLWLELGVTLAYARFNVTGSGRTYGRLHVGGQTRGAYPLYKEILYVTLQLDVGSAIGETTYFFAALRGGASVVLGRLFELRLNLAGLDTLIGQSALFGYTGTLGLAYRF